MFPNTVVGQNSVATATLTNTTGSTLVIVAPSAVAVSGTDFSFIATTCGVSLASNASCTVAIQFTPTAATTRSGAVTIDTASGQRVASFNATGGQAALALSYPGHTPGVSTLAWGNVQVGQGVASGAITLTNTGNATATSVALPVSAPWAVTSSSCAAALAVGASCTFTLTFTPTAAQSYASSIGATTASGSAGVPYALAGAGVNPSLSKYSADNYSYNTPANTSSGHFIGVQNNGIGPVTVNSLSFVASAGNFNAWMAGSGNGNPGGGYCWPGAVLQPGWSCGAWANADTGSGTATFNTSAGAYTYTGSFTARALSYSAATGATSAVSAGQTGALYAMTLSNATPFTYYFPRYGAGAGLATLGRFTGGNAANFVIAGSTCGANLAPGASCTVNIAATGITAYGTSYSSNFQPNGTYQQSGDGGNGTWVGVPNWLVNMGTALADVFVSVTNPVNVTTLTPPSVTASTATVTGSGTYPAAASGAVSFTNNGQTATTLTLTAPAGTSVSPASLSCPASGACGSATVTANSAIGSYSGALGIASSAGGAVPSVSVGMTVNGSIATLTSGTALDFGTSNAGTISALRSWTVRNDGTVPMTLSLGTLNSPFLSFNNTCSSVAPGGTCAIGISMGTASAGVFSQSGISIAGASVGNRNDLSVSGTVTALSPFTYVGYTVAGTLNSVTLTYTFRNNSSVASTITARALTGDVIGADFGSARISTSSTCVAGASLAAGASCAVVVAASKDCWESYTVAATLSNSAGTTAGALYSVPPSFNSKFCSGI